MLEWSEFNQFFDQVHSGELSSTDILRWIHDNARLLRSEQMRSLRFQFFPSFSHTLTKSNYLQLLKDLINYAPQEQNVNVEELLQNGIEIPVIASDGLVYDFTYLVQNYNALATTIEPVANISHSIRAQLEEYVFNNSLRALAPMPIDSSGGLLTVIRIDVLSAALKFCHLTTI